MYLWKMVPVFFPDLLHETRTRYVKSRWRLKSPAPRLFIYPFVQAQITGLCAGGIHWRPVNSPHEGSITRKMIPFDDVIIWISLSVLVLSIKLSEILTGCCITIRMELCNDFNWSLNISIVNCISNNCNTCKAKQFCYQYIYAIFIWLSNFKDKHIHDFHTGRYFKRSTFCTVHLFTLSVVNFVWIDFIFQ